MFLLLCMKRNKIVCPFYWRSGEGIGSQEIYHATVLQMPFLLLLLIISIVVELNLPCDCTLKLRVPNAVGGTIYAIAKGLNDVDEGFLV
mmetsp:Transcript_27828/g.54131  ORF Transcript_27828/g.54131 Transcript_27828/m.54131 type:complete len:89 (-) Transcript_27828:603-869(-)